MSNSEGFGNNKPDAIKLLKLVVDILEEFEIQHFLISGTLLGYIRHNDFIPWDDDIDLMVDETISSKLDLIIQKYPNLNIFKKPEHKYDSIKVCFSDGLEIPPNESVNEWRKNSLTKSDKYCWPFVDLFIFEKGPGLHSCNRISDGLFGKILDPISGECSETFRFFSENEISFFHNDWIKSEFFPLKKVNFLGIDCNIPNNPDYFLRMNYDDNYMTPIKNVKVIHKTEQIL